MPFNWSCHIDFNFHIFFFFFFLLKHHVILIADVNSLILIQLQFFYFIEKLIYSDGVRIGRDALCIWTTMWILINLLFILLTDLLSIKLMKNKNSFVIPSIDHLICGFIISFGMWSKCFSQLLNDYTSNILSVTKTIDCSLAYFV